MKYIGLQLCALVAVLAIWLLLIAMGCSLMQHDWLEAAIRLLASGSMYLIAEMIRNEAFYQRRQRQEDA